MAISSVNLTQNIVVLSPPSIEPLGSFVSWITSSNLGTPHSHRNPPPLHPQVQALNTGSAGLRFVRSDPSFAHPLSIQSQPLPLLVSVLHQNHDKLPLSSSVHRHQTNPRTKESNILPNLLTRQSTPQNPSILTSARRQIGAYVKEY